MHTYIYIYIYTYICIYIYIGWTRPSTRACQSNILLLPMTWSYNPLYLCSFSGLYGPGWKTLPLCDRTVWDCHVSGWTPGAAYSYQTVTWCTSVTCCRRPCLTCSRRPCPSPFCFLFLISYHTTHTTQAERRVHELPHLLFVSGLYGPGWKTLPLCDRTVWDATNAAIFPRTCELLHSAKVPIDWFIYFDLSVFKYVFKSTSWVRVRVTGSGGADPKP